MKSYMKFIVAASLVFSLCPLANAAGNDKGTADEAIALVKKAVAFLKANGKEKAAAAFNDPKGAFVQRDLYIFTADMTTGIAWSHGVNQKLIGKNFMELKDVDGKYFIKDLINVAKEKGSGWVDYKWPNPVSNTIEMKSTYVQKVGNDIVACGIYK